MDTSKGYTMARYKTGDKVFLLGCALAREVQVLSVIRKRLFNTQRYIVREMHDTDSLIEIVCEHELSDMGKQ